jgi:hypothetical protein
MKLADCHPQRKMQARGLCKSCYDQWLKDNNPEFRQAQIANSTKWARENPERVQIIQERRREKQRKDPTFRTRRRDQALRRQYGIGVLEYEKMLTEQKGGCRICFRKPGKTPLHVDHCHKTGRVRGLLCHQCNWYLGTIDADPGILKRITQYLAEV